MPNDNLSFPKDRTNDPLVLKGQASLPAPPRFRMLMLPGEKKGTQLVSCPPLLLYPPPHPKLPWACPGIFTQETTLVSGSWENSLFLLPGMPTTILCPQELVSFPYLGW